MLCLNSLNQNQLKPEYNVQVFFMFTKREHTYFVNKGIN